MGTASMKMVSAAKFSRAERDLRAAKPYGEGAKAFYKGAGVEGGAAEGAAPKELYVALTSDRGLCGGVHSSICKTIRNELLEKPNLDNVGIICVGDKSRAQLGRLFGKNVLCVGSEIGRLPPQFGDAAKIASMIMTCGFSSILAKPILTNSSLLFPIKQRNCLYIPLIQSKQHPILRYTIQLTMMCFNLTWNIPWPQRSIIP